MEPRWDVLHGIHYVADPMTSSAYRDGAETFANALLIAAAPDLQESLALLVDAVTAPDTPGKQGVIEMRLAEARLALAKANHTAAPQE